MGVNSRILNLKSQMIFEWYPKNLESRIRKNKNKKNEEMSNEVKVSKKVVLFNYTHKQDLYAMGK